MKKHILVVTLITAASIRVCFCQSPSPMGSPSVAPSPNGGGAHCGAHSRNVQLFSFYGTKDIVTHHVANLPVNLSERRIFLQITQGAKTDVRIFERQNDGGYTVTQWSNANASDLFAKIDKAIVHNKGENCVGEAVKNLLRPLGHGKSGVSLSAPVSPEEAFGPSIKDTAEGPEDFIRGTVIILC